MKRFRLEARFSAAGGLDGAAGERDGFSDPSFRLAGENLHPPLRVHRAGGTVVGIWGSPIVDGRIDDTRLLDRLQNAPDAHAFARSLDGSFLLFLYDPERRSLSVVSDRFASLPFYYRAEGGALFGSTSCKALYDEAARRGEARVDAEAVFEFLALRRLFGTKTFVRGVSFLDSASLLTLSRDRPAPRVEKYWLPDFTKLALPPRRLAQELADALRHTMEAHTSDGRRYGLMLSGGLDSRALLAAAPAPLVCFTACPSRNNEYEVARRVAEAARCPHVFIERPRRFLDGVVDDAVFLAGMQIYPEVQFANYDAAVAPLADAVFLGLGLDVFFAGLYLPKRRVRLLGRETLFHRLLPLGDDVAGAFLERVGYRMKTSDPFAVVKEGERERLRESLRSALSPLVERAKARGAPPVDRWEYLHLHNFSRHYSFPMAASIRTYADCRVPALSNRLFDLAFALPAEAKANGSVFRRAIALLSPALMAIRDANTNVRAGYPLALQTGVHFAKAAANRLLGTRFPTSPSWWDRSWPEPREALAANPAIRALAEGLPRSPRLDSLGILDLGRIGERVAEHVGGGRDHAVLLNALITVDRFLVPSPEASPGAGGDRWEG